MSNVNELETKKQQFKTLKRQFEVLLGSHIDDKQTLEQISGDCADVMLFSWKLKETGFPYGGDGSAVWREDEVENCGKGKTMQYETNPQGLSWPIKPSIIVDDLVAGSVSIYLSPEIPVSSYSLKQCFENVAFNKKSKKEWVRELRQIADELERGALGETFKS